MTSSAYWSYLYLRVQSCAFLGGPLIPFVRLSIEDDCCRLQVVGVERFTVAVIRKEEVSAVRLVTGNTSHVGLAFQRDNLTFFPVLFLKERAADGLAAAGWPSPADGCMKFREFTESVRFDPARPSTT